MAQHVATQYQDSRTRVRHGQAREAQIAKALANQCGLQVSGADHEDDCTNKVDRYVWIDGVKTALQIKYRETGDDILFEVADKFFGWNHEHNKLGRDMQGSAVLYACLKSDAHTLVLVPCAVARAVIEEMAGYAAQYGWTHEGPRSKTFNYNKYGVKLELKVQKDPRDGRDKMVAYIPAGYFEALKQLTVYRVNLPKNWQS